MSELIVRAYDVRFGDAIFVSIPDVENGAPIEPGNPRRGRNASLPVPVGVTPLASPWHLP